MSKCVICHTANATSESFAPMQQLVECPQCKKFIIDSPLYDILKNGTKLPYTVSSWIIEQNTLYGKPPILLFDDFEKLQSIPEKRMSQKYELFIKYICKHPSEVLYPHDTIAQATFWCKDEYELKALIEKAERNNHLKITSEGMGSLSLIYWTTTYDAIEFIENLGQKNHSNKVFMAFHFTDEMKKQFESTIVRAVTDASNNRLEAIRVSSSSTDHDTKIDDELIAMLKASKAIIADFTGNRTAVYYEAGYAMGLGIPIIWTCRKTDVNDLSFDTRQYPHIIWEDEEDLYTQVVNRLKAKII